MLPPAGLSEAEAQRLSELKPDKFYVENVRSLLATSTWQAQQICETGVRQRVFDKGVEVLCPDGAVGAEAMDESSLPETIQCFEERDGHWEAEDLPTETLRKNTFYRLHTNANSHYA